MSAPLLTFRVDGTPKPKGSLRHVGNGRMVEQLAGSAPWRERVLWAAKQAATSANLNRLEGPVWIAAHFYFIPPKSAPKSRVWWPTTRTSGDLDKLLRNLFDALVDASVIRDDSQIVDVIATKDPDEHPHMAVKLGMFDAWAAP
jgi:Holliday junction resolvase RusA-like endonuclease